MPSTALVNGWMRSCPAFCCPLHTPTLPPHACSGIRLTVPFVVLSGTAAAALDAVAEEDENAGDLFNPSLEMSRERKCAIVRCVALVLDGSMYTRYECVAARSWLVASVCVGGFQQHNRQTPTSLQFLRVLCGLGCICEQNQLHRARFIRPQQRVSLC